MIAVIRDVVEVFALAMLVLPALLGLVVIVQLLRPCAPPVDGSNVINRVRLLWFALTRPELFVDVFPWLTRDELANVGHSQVGAQPLRADVDARRLLVMRRPDGRETHVLITSEARRDYYQAHQWREDADATAAARRNAL